MNHFLGFDCARQDAIDAVDVSDLGPVGVV
jgi:hypothetical protein